MYKQHKAADLSLAVNAVTYVAIQSDFYCTLKTDYAYNIGVAKGRLGGLGPKDSGKKLHNRFSCATGTNIHVKVCPVFSNCACECD